MASGDDDTGDSAARANVVELPYMKGRDGNGEVKAELERLRREIDEGRNIRPTVAALIEQIATLNKQQAANIAWISSAGGALKAAGACVTVILSMIVYMWVKAGDQIDGKADSIHVEHELTRLGELVNENKRDRDNRFDRMQIERDGRYSYIIQRLDAIDTKLNDLERLRGEMDSNKQERNQRFEAIERHIESTDRRVEQMLGSYYQQQTPQRR